MSGQLSQITDGQGAGGPAPAVAEVPEAAGGAAWAPRRHLLDVDELPAADIGFVLDLAEEMKGVLSRPIKKVPALRGKTVVNLFYEASTRTRISFELAAKNLSADVVNVATSTSSVVKGESLVDTVRTLQALGADFVVVRHADAGAPYLVARHFRGSVINGGDGCHAHPTQALLDAFTIREKLGRFEGLEVLILGDILHSRVARSNLWSLTALGARVTLCGPSTLLPAGIERVPGLAGRVRLEEDVDRALPRADVIMVLRLQQERQQGGLLPSLREYVRLYGLTGERLARARPEVLVLHPGPMNEGVEIMPEVATGGASAIEEQVTNGVAVRMAVLYLLAQSGQEAA